jgi:DNA-binding PadR family transcriptional regulator
MVHEERWAPMERELTPVEMIVLAALSDRARYGYELVERIAELTDDRVRIRPGNLYRVLQRLMEGGLARETGSVEAGEDERRRYFRATSQGCRVAAEELAMYGRVLKRSRALREMLADG